MKEQSDRFGAVMNNLGIERADRVFIFMDRLPELYFAALGVLKAGGVIGPLFSAFGPDPVLDPDGRRGRALPHNDAGIAQQDR